MPHTYFVLQPLSDPDVIAVDFGAVEDADQLVAGKPFEGWGDRRTLQVAGDNPDAALMDFVDNDRGILVVSSDIRAIFEHNEVGGVEYLPVAIIDEAGEVKSDDFFVANLRVKVDVVDHDRSTYTGDEDDAESFVKLFLTDEVQVSGPPLLRMDERPDLVLVRDDLLNALNAAGVAGLDPIPTRVFYG